ncbi:gas vesicle protein [Rothia uropygialis]|uniref:gas vesicle protein n=1 Tax=Kocuria sp. 36 TaxID=1415402 RepID=UPI001930E8CA|nr:gas vesicle protein [Kocuria sp. 36]
MTDTAAMQPSRDPRATLPDLIEVLLNKGVYLDLDLIISVADVPLIGVNLRTTIAGIETMLEYGMMRQWDEQTRAWVRKSMTAHLPMGEGEEVIAKMAGGHYQDNFYRTWRPGSAYLTNHRLIIHRRDPQETLWEANLSDITSIRPLNERSIGGEHRTRIHVELRDASTAKLSAVDPERLIGLVKEQLRHTSMSQSLEAEAPQPGPLHEGRVWFLESRAGDIVWRAGQATLSEGEGLVWKSPMDSRALVRLHPRDVWDLETESRDNPTDQPVVLSLTTKHGTTVLATEDLETWQQSLAAWWGNREPLSADPAPETTSPKNKL